MVALLSTCLLFSTFASTLSWEIRGSDEKHGGSGPGGHGGPGHGSGSHQRDCTLSASGGDDGPAFVNAAKSCSKVTIPVGTTLNISTLMTMTGLKNTYIDLQGTVKFNPDVDYWIQGDNSTTTWLLGGKNVTLTGGGLIDGSALVYKNIANSTLRRPIPLTVYQADTLLVKDIRMLDSPMWFNFVVESQHVVYDNITINAHTDNTAHNSADFLHIQMGWLTFFYLYIPSSYICSWDTYRSDDITIKNSKIVNSDDCVSFKPNSTNILVENLDCTGSHGISVGVLRHCENVTVIGVTMHKASNGCRIKAWAGADRGSGIVRNITYLNFVSDAISQPLTIDQCYMTSAAACSADPSNTYIEDVYFKNVTGTGSASLVAKLWCSPDGRCGNINLDDISLSYPSGTATYSCQNVELKGNSAYLFPACAST
ncbi:glycoside hydrolase family 28 protein [Flagelloscypha sp. PMI_526]|nr:glycoside hydrolase family 28 protein [Flagelloscypha sp. PMI_526]